MEKASCHHNPIQFYSISNNDNNLICKIDCLLYKIESLSADSLLICYSY